MSLELFREYQVFNNENYNRIALVLYYIAFGKKVAFIFNQDRQV